MFVVFGWDDNARADGVQWFADLVRNNNSDLRKTQAEPAGKQRLAKNANQPKGSFDGPQRAYTIEANDQLRSAEEYRGIVVAFRNSAPVLLRDVADVVEDAENVRLAAWMNDVPAVIMNVQRQPGANVIEVVDRVKALLPSLTAALPGAIETHLLTDRTVTIRASVRDTQLELLLAVALVIRLRSRPLNNVQTFDIGLAGPLAGFVVALAILHQLGELDHGRNLHELRVLVQRVLNEDRNLLVRPPVGVRYLHGRP